MYQSSLTTVECPQTTSLNMSDLTYGEQTNRNNLTDHHMSGDELVFFVNGKKITEKHADPEMTLLTYLRRKCILKYLSHTAPGSRVLRVLI
ncbi:unnamed protein product [Oncorhynchus mykiss]|uniref:Uncharacterized protein n=1 Tax=Oncorhynchus mykiss TaxID=8022 RepID=A0A060ZRA4_ONCMY|nr:unnamed protein product [Oncorhynchus mykiss]